MQKYHRTTIVYCGNCSLYHSIPR